MADGYGIRVRISAEAKIPVKIAKIGITKPFSLAVEWYTTHVNEHKSEYGFGLQKVAGCEKLQRISRPAVG